MQISSNQFFANVSRNLLRVGFGVAIFASTLAGQAEAQVDITFGDLTPITDSHSMARPTTAVNIDKIHRYSLDEAGNLNGQITVTGDMPSGLQVFAMQGKQIVHQASTNATGEFSMAQMMPGQYSIVIAGRNQLAAQGIMVDQDRSQDANDYIELSTIQTNYQGIQDLVTTALPKQITTSLGTADSKFQQVSASFLTFRLPSKSRSLTAEIKGQVVSLKQRKQHRRHHDSLVAKQQASCSS